MVPTDLLQDRTVSDQPIGYLLTQAFAICNLNTSAGVSSLVDFSLAFVAYCMTKKLRRSLHNEPK